MTQIRAFVGHSFVSEDEAVVRTFLDYFDQMKGALSDFDWSHAKAVEPKELAAKVLKEIEGKNVFIGICTRRERVIDDAKLRPTVFDRGRRSVADADLVWKTSDWIIQEIGLAIGRGMVIVLLVENGCRKPGGLQGNVEFISFDRSSPERAFGSLLEMMKALSPPTGAGETTSADATEKSEEEIEAPSKDEDELPDDAWDRQKYENAFLWKLFKRDIEGAKKIDAAFIASKHGVVRETVAAWSATAELWRIRFGQEGSLGRLRDFHTEFPENGEISTALADGFAALGMHPESAMQFLIAADLVSDNPVESERLRGLAAAQFSKAGERARADELLKGQRKILKSAGKKVEIEYLSILKDIYSDGDENHNEIEVLERVVQLAPDDWNARFNLAYKYSQVKIRDMSLYHYTQIPYSERTAIAWNNLGVAYQEFEMPAKSIAAYRTSSSKGETLAMSNLAYKFMNAGFLSEANDQLQLALKTEDFHRNVGEAVSALKDIPGEEDKRLKDALKKVEPKRQFFHRLGEAITYADVEYLPDRWKGPDCELVITVANGEFLGVGEYERTTTSNTLAGLLQPVTKTTRYRVCYEGKILGRRVVGTVTKKSEGESAGAASLLGSLGEGDDIEFAMIVEQDELTIVVAERYSSTVPKFYELRVMEPVIPA
jgi:tetratricopeptide (TPR) repeat protein